MTDLHALLHARQVAAFATLAGEPVDPLLHRSAVADLQANGALPLARRLGVPGVEVAARVLAHADLGDLATGSVSGPGYLNLTIRPEALDRLLDAMAGEDRLGVATVAEPQRVLVDYSGPNVAKEMHVGHLRSTIIGDAIVRVLRWLGHDVTAFSHLGDRGTPFGMLLEWLVEIGEDAAAHDLSVGDLDGFYKAAQARFDHDAGFAARARRRVVLLQSGDPESVRLWRILVDESARYFRVVNERLGVVLSTSDFLAESFYHDRIAGVVAELEAKGLLSTSDGALCAFPPGFTGRDGKPFPFMVRKSDGGYGYQATDLAALRYRLVDLGADRVIYVTGAPQRQHLAMAFAVARQAGWLTPPTTVEHKAFGSVLGEDGKMLRSRRGRSVKLIDLLDEAVARAGALIGGDPALALAVGIGALKYADLRSDMVKDYGYDPGHMLAFTGDTGGYLQYAHVRARSILRRATAPAAAPRPRTGPERALALALLGFPAAVTAVAGELEPHRLARHLRELAVAFTAFFESSPVLTAPDPVRGSRLALCELTARTLAQGLELLGIEAPPRM